MFGAAGQPGLAAELRATVAQASGLLADTREPDARGRGAGEAQAGANAREASADLGVLRAEVEANLRKLAALINDINRKMALRATRS